jgi:peptidoglycan/LPS O-acetylase OafA/YrhL
MAYARCRSHGATQEGQDSPPDGSESICFLVLSGFLITTLWLDEREQFGTISLRLFWLRRFLRLMSAYIFYIAAITVAIAAAAPDELSVEHGWTPAELVASLWPYTAIVSPNSGIWSRQYLTVHLWSLSLEEQFYFIWPVALALAVALAGLPRWRGERLLSSPQRTLQLMVARLSTICFIREASDFSSAARVRLWLIATLRRLHAWASGRVQQWSHSCAAMVVIFVAAGSRGICRSSKFCR